MSAVAPSARPELLSPSPRQAPRALVRSALALAAALGLASGACGDSSGGFTLGPEAQIDISPLSIDFGDVPRGEVARRNITVRHVGSSGVIELDPIKLVTSSPDFEIGLVEATTLHPGEQTRIQVVYNSAHDEPDEGELVIGHNLAGNPETRITLSSAGQRARLVASPAVMDFGIVQAGAPRTLDLTVLNGGSANATLTGAEFEDDNDGDFHIEIPPGTVVTPGGNAVVKVTYAPSGRDRDLATLHVLTDREDVSLDVVVGGEEETPVLTVEPSLVQLGWTRPFEVSQRQVTIRNDGNTHLDISSIALTDQPATLKLTGVPVSAFRLEPGEAVVTGLVFAPVQEHPMTAEPLARIRIESSDEARNPLLVPVYGAAGDPSIQVIPEDVVDFAYVAEGFTATREVTVLNVGDSAVTLTDAELVDPTSDEFVLVNATDLPVTLNPGENFDLAMTFENKNGAQGTEYAKLFLHTTDPVVPEYPLDVIARRAQRPTCEASFVPDLLAFGAYRPGATGTNMMKVVNFGSGNCIYRGYELGGCLEVTEGIRTRFECNDQIAFNPFRLTSEPTENEVLGPGGVLEIPVEFKAPNQVTSLYGRDSYYGRLALTMSDPNSGRFQFVTPPGGWGAGVNLRAESAVPLVAVEPSTIDFGLVRTDCTSSVRQVRVAAT
ncbi:MAG: choice-of-anchor D domain-containing protein, partial [Myxococcales bacterium]|nr:choice-of-anchor D domain-containing protein [Myxococcales bacterium]